MQNLKTLIIVSILATTACKARQKAGENSADNRTAKTAEVKAGKGFEASNIDFKYLSAKAKIKTQTAGSNAVTEILANVRICKDSAVWASATLVGLEVARVMFTVDSIKLMDRVHQKYIAQDYSYASEVLGTEVDFYTLQALLLGNNPPNMSNLPKENLSYESGLAIFSMQDTAIAQKSKIDFKTKKLVEYSALKEAEKQSFVSIFSQFITINDKNIPQLIQFEFVDKAKKSTAELNYMKIDFPVGVAFPFSIPAKYKRM